MEQMLYWKTNLVLLFINFHCNNFSWKFYQRDSHLWIFHYTLLHRCCNFSPKHLNLLTSLSREINKSPSSSLIDWNAQTVVSYVKTIPIPFGYRDLPIKFKFPTGIPFTLLIWEISMVYNPFGKVYRIQVTSDMLHIFLRYFILILYRMSPFHFSA